ncbi:MAG TPA: Hsp20/alpha crystallin family protein [Vicinamibacterales bacterium]|nr:Hsp20/alpha crystallin family protein [Vicinamibacterales bacterium]
MADRPTDIAQREKHGPSRHDQSTHSNPLATLDRFADEMDRIFDDFGFGRGLAPRSGSSWSSLAQRQSQGVWMPQIEVFHRNNELVVHADLPGLKKDDVAIEVMDNELTISGERRQEQQNEREGVYRSERSYGSFYRTVPLPEGAMTDQAKASFKDGVLEITIPAPPQSTKGRRLEIKDGAETKK